GAGRFYRRFGPLGREGGGRRLNVLVTRAREEVHLVTSIPPSAYRTLPPIPPDQRPGGAWLLYAYLQYAEWLKTAYDEAHRAAEGDPPAPQPAVRIRESKFPSPFAVALANRLVEQHQVGSNVHWGNDGFCVDIALAHPKYEDDVTIGIL